MKDLKYWIKRLLWIFVGILLICISVNVFLGPHNIAAGGVTGFALIIEHLTGIDRANTVLVFNILILILTYFTLGKEVFLNTVIGAMILPIIMKFVPHIELVKDTMFSVIIGSAIFGAAVALLYRNNASSGGTAIPPLILKKYFGISTSVGLFVTDFIVVVLSLIVFDIESFFYAIFSIWLTSAALGYIESGFNKKKSVFIISKMQEAILNDILHVINRGVTVIPAKGGFKGNDIKILMVTINSKDYNKVIDVVDKYDKSAFIIANTVSDVHGLGFTYHSASV